jgi:hypothetical protein
MGFATPYPSCGLTAAVIALAIIAAVQAVGSRLATNFGKISTSLKSGPCRLATPTLGRAKPFPQGAD